MNQLLYSMCKNRMVVLSCVAFVFILLLPGLSAGTESTEIQSSCSSLSYFPEEQAIHCSWGPIYRMQFNSGACDENGDGIVGPGSTHDWLMKLENVDSLETLKWASFVTPDSNLYTIRFVKPADAGGRAYSGWIDMWMDTQKLSIGHTYSIRLANFSECSSMGCPGTVWQGSMTVEPIPVTDLRAFSPSGSLEDIKLEWTRSAPADTVPVDFLRLVRNPYIPVTYENLEDGTVVADLDSGTTSFVDTTYSGISNPHYTLFGFKNGVGWALQSNDAVAYVVPIPYVTPSSLTFFYPDSTESISESFSIRNIGGGMLSGDVDLGCGSFFVNSPLSYNLAHGQSQNFDVSFFPSGTQSPSCTIDIGLSDQGVECQALPGAVSDCDFNSTGFFQTSSRTYDLSAQGNYLYLAEKNIGMEVVDISDPSQPTPVTTFDTPDDARVIAITGTNAIVADRSGIVLADLAIPTEPHQLSYLQFNSGVDVRSVDTDGQYAYVGNINGGVFVADISNPQDPIIVNTISDPTESWELDLNFPYLFVAEGLQGIGIYDISSPTQPEFLARCATPGIARDVLVAGGTAFAACDDQGLAVLDVTDAMTPTLINFLPMEELALGLEKYGDILFVTDYSFGVHLVDVSHPASPVIIQTVALPDSVSNVFALKCHFDQSKGLLHVADFSGFQTIQMTCPQLSAANDRDPLLPLLDNMVQACPNPFNPFTNIHFELTRAASVSVTIFDLAGHRVCNLMEDRFLSRGPVSIPWNGRTDTGRSSASGTYFFRVETEGMNWVGKIALIK